MGSEPVSADTNLSVLVSVYSGDEPTQVNEALRSTFEQTQPPDQVVVVQDGPLTQPLRRTVREWADQYPDLVTIVRLAENRGLGEALAVGLRHCRNDLVARMDADDRSRETRFETQLDFLANNPDVAVVGGYIGEFVESPNHISNVRGVPTAPAAIERYARFRNPMNHVTVMFEKDSVEAVGGYRARPGMEDYDLWVRMLQRGYTLANIPEILVDVRTGREMYRRRGGFDYAVTEYRFQRELLERGFTSLGEFVANIAVRVPIRLLPTEARELVYERFLRG